MRRLYRCAGAFPESEILNLRIPLEIEIDPEAHPGILDDHHYVLSGVRKRAMRVGLGLPGWGPGYPNRRNVVSEWSAALAAIDPVLVPTADDLLVGWLDPIGFYCVNNRGSMQLTLQAASALQDVGAFPGLKILLVGDTHHGLLTLANSLGHGLQEPWDALLLCHQASHLDWFRSLLGDDRVFLYHLQISPQQLGLRQGRLRPPSERPQQALSFYGGFSHLHPRRSAAVQQLKERLGPAEFHHTGRVPRPHWMDGLADDAAVLCSCLNNQISTYHVYSLLSGCQVFSDRYHTASGWGRFFLDQQHVVLYDSVDELIDLYRHYRRHPDAAAAIAEAGRLQVEQHFRLDANSHPWLSAGSVEELRQGLRISTALLESHDQPPLRWSNPQQLVEDLNVYQLLHDLCQFFPRVLWISGDNGSKPLERAVLEQLPRCHSTRMLQAGQRLDLTPVVMTRLPQQRELLVFAATQSPYLLLLLPPVVLQANPELATRLEEQRQSMSELALQWLGRQAWRSQLAITRRSPRTADACWPLESGWQAALLNNHAVLDRMPAIYQEPVA